MVCYGGYVIVVIFVVDGLIECSGLLVMCYDVDELYVEFGFVF